jgi:cellulose biosynthesis protein BcsQ
LIIDLPPGLAPSVPALIAKAAVVLVPVRASLDDLLAVPAVVEALAGHPHWAS